MNQEIRIGIQSFVNALKKTPLMVSFEMVEQKERNSNFLSCIKELILELKDSETVLLLEKFKMHICNIV